jgi:prepilin-type N-terminal cleavage/methylation domain-containing protein
MSKKLKGFTLPELMISLFLSLIVIFIIVSSFDKFSKNNHTKNQSNSHKLDRLNMLVQLETDMLKAHSIKERQAHLIIYRGADTISYTLKNETISRKSGTTKTTADFPNLQESMSYTNDSSLFILRLIYYDPAKILFECSSVLPI